MSLEARLAQLADETEGVRTTDEHEYTRSGTVFALNPSPGVVELRLGAEIADAAARTPDTTISARGADWVRFAPRTWDDMARDRLDAWFRVAWRLAEGRSPQK